MKEEQERYLSEYIKELKPQGKLNRNIKYAVRLFYRHINESGIDFTMLGIREAREFQEHLTTKTGDGGDIHYTKAGVALIIGVVSSFYEYLRKRKIIYSNPFKGIKRVKQDKSLPRNILKEDDMSRLLNHLKEFFKGKDLIERKHLYRAHVISELMYSTGARINEIKKLKESDIDFYRGVVRIEDSKSGKEREGILNSFCEKVLRIYTGEMREYMIFNRPFVDKSLLFGARSLDLWLNKILNRESGKLGFGKFTSHNFRHAVGYHLLRRGCDIRYIQEILGHSALHSTQVYTRVDKEDLKSVIDEYHPRILRKRETIKR